MNNFPDNKYNFIYQDIHTSDKPDERVIDKNFEYLDYYFNDIYETTERHLFTIPNKNDSGWESYIENDIIKYKYTILIPELTPYFQPLKPIELARPIGISVRQLQLYYTEFAKLAAVDCDYGKMTILANQLPELALPIFVYGNLSMKKPQEEICFTALENGSVIDFPDEVKKNWERYKVLTTPDKDLSPWTLQREPFTKVLNKDESIYLFNRTNNTLKMKLVEGKIAASGSITALKNGVEGKKNRLNIFLPEQTPFWWKVSEGSYYDPQIFTSEEYSPDYSKVFLDCTALYFAPDISRYGGNYLMCFSGCSNLQEISEFGFWVLGWNWLNNNYAAVVNFYNSMFKGCTSLKKAPSLPIKSVLYEYNNKIYGRRSLYNSMFEGCTNLKEVPLLGFTQIDCDFYSTVRYSMLEKMFLDCASLNSIKVDYQGSFPSYRLTIVGGSMPRFSKDWVKGVSPTGNFYYNGSGTYGPEGTGAEWGKVPQGWNIIRF